MITTAWLARKVGMGLQPGDDPHVDPHDWLNSQLSMPTDRMAIQSIKNRNAEPVAWPIHLTYSLNDRIERLVRSNFARKAIDLMGLDDAERGRQLEEDRKQNSVAKIDIYRYLHAAMHGQCQIRHRLSHFWLNHFTVGVKETTPQLISDFWDNAIDANLDGTFENLLYRATTHPAMLTYLDNIYNIGPNSPKARECTSADCVVGLNDNLARELLELHTVSPARGYSENDIHEAAKVLCGWGSIFELPFMNTPVDFSSPYEPYHAEPGGKSVLGYAIPAGPTGLRVLTENLAAETATAAFLSRKLATHFIGERFSAEDFQTIFDAWTQTEGYLPTVHRAVMERAMLSQTTRFHWPVIWFIQLCRMSGARLIKGYEDIDEEFMEPTLRDPERILEEIGNSFWSVRQPDGFSDQRSDWISNEHMDRRIRLASIIQTSGGPTLSTDRMMELYGFSDRTRSLVEQGRSETERFVLLACSPEFMEA
jgi:uncharacterized protein (DUF1800 family)